MTTGGSKSVSHADYFERLVDRICKILTTITKEGTAYRVDIRLRPGGSMGRMAQSFAAFETHFARTAELWERQAYLRARPIAGDLDIAAPFMASLAELIYRPTSVESLATYITAMRRRMELELTKEKTGERHIKLGSGGIVDIEFIAQFLQLAYGSTHSILRVNNTLAALEAARHARLLPDPDVAQLRDSYRFLRTVQNRLRVVADRETRRCRRILVDSIAWRDASGMVSTMVALQGNGCWLITSAIRDGCEGFTRRPSVVIMGVNPGSKARFDAHYSVHRQRGGR